MTEWLPQALYIFGGILAIVLIWAGIELALTLRRTRKTVSDLDPTIEKLNSMSATLEPASKRIDPLLERVSLTVDAVNLEIMRADQILSDVSDVTGTLSGTVSKFTDITDAPLNLLTSAADKVREVLTSKKTTRSALNSSGSEPDAGSSASDQTTAGDTAKAQTDGKSTSDSGKSQKAETHTAHVKRISDSGYFNYPQATPPCVPPMTSVSGTVGEVSDNAVGCKADPVDFNPEVS